MAPPLRTAAPDRGIGLRFPTVSSYLMNVEATSTDLAEDDAAPGYDDPF